MSLIVLYLLHNTSILSFYIEVVLTLSISVNGAASRPALLQCRAMGSTTDIQLLNSLYRIAKYVGFRCRLNVPI